ncbi:MAG: hypothetical protein HYT31_02010 [Parcubacteria group bacterium]|nr:hypothetical protein [Parcubacteria group bacterium]
MHDKLIKIGFWVFAATAVFFGAASINQKIKIVNVGTQESNAATSAAAFDDARLRVIDTDEDGLDDWSELNVHKTSPYLADSDSDGATDSEEVALGTDPVCPAGRVCGSDIINTLEGIQEELTAAELGASAEAGQGSPEATDFSPESQAALDALEAGGIPTAEQIRALLRDSGIPEDQLAGTSDEDLVQLFQEVAEEQQTP